MGKIKLLSSDMIGKIAAGEVVERPAAAIKELVENSLDAGATAVTVDIREGGLESLRVTDNGSGIDESDIRMAFERHATSKISREQDLFSIRTLGFRGEALASIAAVSHVRLTTRTKDRDTGTCVVNEGGTITDVSEIACPVGTTILVRDLFYNVPVRKGFMKKASQEASAISDLMTQLILSRPDVSFRYISNGKTEYHSPGDGQLASALHTIYGGQALKAMREVNDHANGLLIRGYVGIGESARGNRSHEYFFINGRVMHSRLMSEAVETACRERVMIGKFPTCALHIQIAFDAVDVNVHPNKLEVRFRDEPAVYDAILSAVVQALREGNAFERPVEMRLTKEEPSPAPSLNAAPRIKTPGTVSVSDRLPPEAAIAHDKDAPRPMPEFRELTPAPKPLSPQRPSATVSGGAPTGSARQPQEREPLPSAAAADASPAASASGPQAKEAREYLPQAGGEAPSMFYEVRAEQVNSILPELQKPMKVFGALFNTYILVEYMDQLLLVDQHAVHERLLFDRLMSEHDSDLRTGQELLVPMIFSVTNREQRLLEDNREALESIGLIVESFGERDVAVRTIPVILGEAQARDFVTDVIAELESGRDPAFEKKRTALLQTACKHAVKGGEALSEDQLRSLLDEMIEKKVTPTCPHGRPLVVALTHRELDKKFKRIQS